jgi:hypothetical protein
MTEPRRPRHHWPRLRWHLRLARLHLARGVLLVEQNVSGARLGLSFVFAAAFLLGWEAVRPPLEQLAPDGSPVVVKAALNLIIQIALIILSSLISAALAPKPKPPEVIKAQVPVVEDGKGIERLYGSCWIDDSIVLGFKQMGTKKIRAKGGKKG